MPQTVTIAQALQSNLSGLTVQDSAANIAAALPNAGLVARISLFELSGPATIGTAAADQFAALGIKFVAGYPLAVQDSVAAMIAGGNAAGLALASSRGIIDAAYNLLAAPQADFVHITSVTLTGTPTLSAAQLIKLESLPGFTIAPAAHFTFTDTLAAAAPVLVAHAGWFGAATAVVVRLDGSQVSAGVAVALAALANASKIVTFTPVGLNTTLNVNAAAHDLAGAAASLNRIGLLVGVHITVSNDGSAISAADAVALTTITGFAPAQHTLTVLDTGSAITAAGAALFNHGYPQIVVASGTFSGIAAELLDPTLRIMAGASVSMTGNPTLAAAQIQVLASLPGFAVAQGATLTVLDTITHILAHAGAMAPASTIVATDSESITAANLTTLGQIAAAHPGHFNLAGHTLSVTDSPANLAALGGQAIALTGSYTLNANGLVTAAQLVTLRDGLGVTANGHSVTVSDTATNLLAMSGNLALVSATQLNGDANVNAAQAQSLAGQPGFSVGGHALTITDNAAALLALAGGVQALGHMVLAGSQSVSASQVIALAALGSAFSTSGASLTVTDTATALLALPVGVNALASAYALSASAFVSASQFTSFYSPLHVALNGFTLSVTDTPANLLTIPSQALGQANAFALGAGGTVSEAQFLTLRDILHVGANGHSLTLTDTAASLLTLSGSLALVGATQLSADAIVTASQAQTLAGDPNFSTAAHQLTIADSAANLLGLSNGVASLSGHLVLNADQNVSAAQAAGLVSLGSVFSTASHALIVTDTPAALLGLAPGVTTIATGYALDADGTVSAAGYTALTFGLDVTLNGHGLTVSDTPANLLGLTFPGEAAGFSLSASGTVSEAQFVTLRDTLGVVANGHSLTLADTAADLLALAGNLSLDGATQLTADASVTAAQAITLASDPGFSTGGHVLRVVDSAANLLALPVGVQTLSGHLILATGQSVSAAQAAALAAFGTGFSTNGNTLTVSDSAANLLALPVGVAAIAGAYVLNTDATVSASDFVTLISTLHLGLNGNMLTVSDTPANLLGLPGQLLSHASALCLSAGGTVSESQFLTLRDTLGVAGSGHTLSVLDNAANLLALSGDLSLIGTTTLNGPANVTAAQATILAGEPGFSAGTQVLTVTDTAANLLGLAAGVQSLSGHLVLNASQIVTAAQLTALAALGSAFSTHGATLTVTDTAAALLALSPGAGALAGAFALGANAVVTAAQFAILAGSLDVGLAGHSLTVSDTPANLLAVPAQLLGQASGFSLSAGGTVSEAQFVTLRDVVGVVGNANLLIVADTASNLLALSGNLALIGATQLSTNANVSAAQAQGLAGEPAFSLGGNTLTIADTAANLLALSSGVQTLSGHLLLTASQSVTASQTTALAALGSIFSTGGATLTVSDTAAALVGLSPSALALAGAYALSADASVNAAQFATLYGTLHVSLAGHALSVSDTPVNLLAVPLQALSHATGFSLSAGGTVNENQFAFLRDTMGVAGNGHTLTVTDTAANLLALSGNLAMVGGTQLAAAANLNAAQATTLAGEPAFATGGYVLSVTDNAANLLGLATGVQTLSGHLVLAGSQSVSGAQATGLAALGGAFSLGGTTLTVTDSAANLLSLPLGVTAIVGAYALNGNATVTEAQFVTLRDNLAVNLNGHTLVVSDTAADLLALSGNLAMDSATLLSADASVTAAQAISLAADPAFATAGHILTITDTAANLLALPTLVQMLSGHLVLASSQSVSAAQASGLAALGSSFSAGSNTLTVSDSAANLLAVPLGVAAIAGAYLLTSDATVNAAQFTTLRDSLHIGLNGHAITILDNAGNLAGLSGNLADASACLLSANGTVSAAAAAILNGEPGFSNAGHTLTIADTVTNLLGLSAPLQSLVNAFTLSANQVASAVQLAGLAAYGIKFTDGAATLGVADTAANLAGLTAPELALVNAETMTQSATISAAMASTLVGLPGFSLGSGVFMTVQDSAANLAALPWNVLAVASMEMLPPGPVTLSAAQAASLYLLQHFSAAGATITVQDSVAALSNNSNWSPIATYTHVVDTAGNLAANAGLELLQNANAVTLAGNATIGAAQAASLASIGGYSTGSNTLTVADSAPAIAQNEAAINAVASTAVVDSTAPVSAAQADCLASLANANKLVFQAGDTLSIVDSFAALTSNTNVSGLALASNITINDTAANLAVAASHDWGNVFPTYVLSGDAVINGAQAVALAGLGSHLLLNGHHLAVQDTAANVVNDAAALTSLGISATVIDQAAAIGGQATALAGLGGRLAAVLVTDINPLSPVTAATLAPLASKLAGLPIAVAGNAAAIDANIGALHTLGAHIAISLTDSASAVGAYAADLTTLGAALAISLTDVTPVSATTAAALSALTTRFVAGTFLAVSDTAGDIASQTATLVAMGNAIGAVSLIGGSGVSVVQAAALLGLQNHLGFGVQLAVSGPAADIAANLSALLALQMDGRLASLTDAGEPIAAVAAISTALNELGATVDVSDTLANFNGGIANLAGITGLAAVSITDSVHPVFALSLAQYSAEASLLARLTNAHTVAITDTAGAIEADLASPSSVLASIAGPLSLAVTNGAPLVLSQAVALTAGVAAILADFTGNLKITGVDIADLGAVAALSPHAITIADTTAAIGADLASGSSLILAGNTAISSIVASGGGNISLTAAQALSANVDDGVNSALAKLTGAGLVVTGATVAQIALLEAATVVPSAISINDTAANITAALINPASSVMNALSSILTLHVNDAGAITLTAAQDTAAGVNDSASAALTKLTGGSLDVTDVTTSNLGVIESGARTPDHILIADSGTDIAAAIGVMLLDRLNLGPITVTSGNVILSVAQATTAHVADGPGSLVSLLPGHSYGVSGAAVGDIATLTALAQAPSTIAVSDSSDNVAADISSAISQVATHANSVSVTGGILSLTDAQAHGVIAHGNIAALDDMQPGQTIDITGVPVADIADFASIAGGLPGGVTLHLEVSDTALALANDLDQNVASLLIHDAAFVNSVTLSGAGGILNAAQLSEVAGLPGLNGNGITVPVSDTASNIAGLGAGARALAGTNVTVVDSLGVLSNLLGALQATYDGHLTITLTDPGSTVGKTPGEFSALLPTIDAITTAACIIVTGNAAGIAAIAPTLASDRHVAAVQVHDSAANVVSNLSAIASLGNAVTVELTDWLPISAALAQALVNQNLAHLAAWGITVADTGAQIAAMAESGAADVAFLIAQGSALTTDSNLGLIDAQTIVALQGSISTNGHALNVWDTVANVTAPGAAALLSTLIGSTLFGGVYLRTTGGTVNVTVATAVALFNIPGLSVNNPDHSVNAITVADTTAAIGADLAAGSSTILTNNAAISAIVATGGGNISLTATQALTANVDDGVNSVFAKLVGAGLVVTDATVAQAAALENSAVTTMVPGSISINDTAANITAALINPASAIMTSLNAIFTLHVSDANPVILTAAQDTAAGVNDGASSALAKLTGGTLDVTGVTTSNLGVIESGAHTPNLISIADSGIDIAAAISVMLLDRLNLGPITVTSGNVVLTVAQATTAHVADGPGCLVWLLPSHSYSVSGAAVSDIATLMALGAPPATIVVSDTSDNVAADLAGAGSLLGANAAIVSVSVTGGVLTLTDAQANGVITNANVAALDHMMTGQTIDITGVPVADITAFSALAAGLAGVTLHLEVTDTALALANDLDQNVASLLTHDAAFVNSVALSGAGGTLNAAQLSEVAAIAGLNANGISVPVHDTAGAIATLGAAARTLAGTNVTVNDISGNVANVLGTLQSAYDGHLTINLTDIGSTITETAGSFAALMPTLDAISNSACIIVTGDAADIAAIAPSLATDRHIAGVQVSDTAANMVSNLSAIASLGSNATVTLTDGGPISASLVQALVNQNLTHFSAPGVSVADTASQIAAMAESGAADVAFLIARGSLVTATSNIGLVDGQAIQTIRGTINTNGYQLNVWDTAAHLTAPGASALLATLLSGGFFTGVYLKTSGGTVSLTASNALALFAIAGLSINNPDNSVNTITVADTAAHLDSNFANLQSHAGAIGAFVINGSATVNAATLLDMQTLGATTAPGVSLTLSDTADNILIVAAITGASVQASAWTLSGNAVENSASVLTLAGLANFSTAGHTLTVALGADTPVASVSQANQLGALGAGLIVTGHEYTISGSVASLAGLSAAGAAVAHVALTDSFSVLSTLGSASPLLTGTIVVNDAESLTASQTQGFLGLLSAAHVADSSVSFTGGAETVVDTVANLRALTASTAWTGNTALQSHLSLVADDTVANLDNPANTAFLNTLSAQMLSTTATLSAANATTLTGLSNFILGGQSLMVSDSAANLLNPVNTNGLGLATTITLNGAASLNGAQSERLMQISHFTLTQTLNITDTSVNLLDGTLSGLIGGHAQVHVALAGPETLDAQTAAALVSLQGFSDTLDINIVDDSSYLLAPAASAAEAMAASVSLEGNEIVSANTVLRLSEIPHFISSGGTLTLAGNDFANAPTLKAIADMGSHFSEGGHSLTLTQDDLGLTPTEYAAIIADGFVPNGHVISAELVNSSVSDSGNTLALTATGLTGASVNVYDHSGVLLSTTTESTPTFTVSAPDAGSGNNFSITETVGGVESAPVVVLNATTLEEIVSGVSAAFATTGQIQVGPGEYLNLYTAGATLPNAPSLVYDPNAHTISLDIPSVAPVVLITLGAGTHPASIDASEILVKHHS